MQAEILTEGKIVLVPVEVPTPTAAVVAGFTVLAALGVAAAAIAYNAGVDEGVLRARRELQREFDKRFEDAVKRSHTHGTTQKMGASDVRPSEVRT
jgi:hypothetical protein